MRRSTSTAGQRIRRFVFTLNNWTQIEYDWLTKEFAPTTRWFIVAKETGALNGTPHLQGACILGTQMRFSQLKTLTGFQRAYLHTMDGKPEHSLAYCSKQDLSYFEHGTLPTPGKRNDLHEVVARVMEGTTLQELATQDELGAVAIVKFHKGLTVLRSFTRGQRTGPPKIFWVFGKTGVGKTRCCFKAARALVGGRDMDIWISSGSLRWFHGYDGQSVVILDDFRAKHVEFSYLLRLLDRYPVAVEFKGGNVSFQPSYIFITCNKDPKECFSKRNEHIPEDIAQLERRLTKVIEIKNTLGKGGRKTFVKAIFKLSGIPASPGDGTGTNENTDVPGSDLEDSEDMSLIEYLNKH